MSHGKLRENKNCLNCGHFVEERFCPNCGQENTETRQPFHFLFTHFIEDFTHYDGQFWKTIKYLLFRPGRLTKEYLAGKRQQFVPPVKLYIFISFVTFLLIAFSNINVNDNHNNSEKREENKVHLQSGQKAKDAIKLALQQENLTKADSLKLQKVLTTLDTIRGKNIDDDLNMENGLGNAGSIMNANNMKQFDSLAAANNHPFRYTLSRPFAEKYFELKEKGTPKKEIINGFLMSFFHTLPKALFLYLPFFALLLWIFHNKKKWWYFDHGIFTLHYFSFLLLAIFLAMVSHRIMEWLPNYPLVNILFNLLFTALYFYSVFYFFIAHHRVYGTRKLLSIFLGILIFILNTIGFTFLLIVLVGLSFLMIH